MRGTLPKRTNMMDSSRSNSPTTPISSGPMKTAGIQHPAIQRQHSILDGLTVLDQNSVMTPSAASMGQDDHYDNPYKYSKEFMLNLYKPYAVPVEIEKHEYVIVEECQQPLAKAPLSENEKKVLCCIYVCFPFHAHFQALFVFTNNSTSQLLSGPVHSSVSRKRAENATEQNVDGRPLRNKGEFVNSPTVEKDVNSTRFGLNRARGMRF
jgi:hypothetical protein